MNNKINADFVHFLESMVNLDALDRMTTNLDNELKDSQAVMNEIKGMIDALPGIGGNVNSVPDSNEDLSNFLSAGTPQVMMPDMDTGIDLDDVDVVIATIKLHVEGLRKNFIPATNSKRFQTKQLESLELERYASNLDQLSKRLSNLKLNKETEVNTCNEGLKTKLSLLCEDINMFTKMIQAKTTQSEVNKNWPPTQQTTNALDYDNIFNRLLADINSVSYLLQSKD